MRWNMFKKRGSKRTEESVELWRAYIAAFDEATEIVRSGLSLSKEKTRAILDYRVRIVGSREQMTSFLEQDMDVLTADERSRVYRHIASLFPKQLGSLVGARLSKEGDPICCGILRQIVAKPHDKDSKRTEECVEVWRAYIAAFDKAMETVANGLPLSEENKRTLVYFGVRIVASRKQMTLFLEQDMDLLMPDERSRVYRHIGSLFPEQLDSIVAARRSKEGDARCLDIMRQIVATPRDKASRERGHKFCLEVFDAQKLLCEYDTGKAEIERKERLQKFKELAWLRPDEDVDRVDMLVLFSLSREPKDRGLFLSAIGGLTDTDIICRKATKSKILEALILFGQQDRARRIEGMSSSS
jgi:hypothetical protein